MTLGEMGLVCTWRLGREGVANGTRRQFRRRRWACLIDQRFREGESEIEAGISVWSWK